MKYLKQKSKILHCLLLFLVGIIFFCSHPLHAHNWRKKNLVLFVSYEMTPQSLVMNLCLPADLANSLLKAPLDFNYILTKKVRQQVQEQLQESEIHDCT